MRRIPWLVAPLALVSLVACGSSSTKDAIPVTSTNRTCVATRTTFDAGKLTFEVENKGSQPTELYVFGKGDRVISEVENVGPGTSRTLTVNLKAGTYELACKPGQRGRGIRVPITVTGAGGKESSEGATAHEREIEVTAVEYRFEVPTLDVERGEAIEFKLRNNGEEEHEFEVLGPDHKALGEVGPTASGKSGEVVLKFAKAGTYTYVCGIDDHEAKGMKGTFVVE